MIINEIFSDELLQQAAAELEIVINNRLPLPYECQHRFSNGFEEKIQSLIRSMGTTCYTVAIQDHVIHK